MSEGYDNGYSPHPAQLKFHQSKQMFRFMVSGRSGGKTIAGVNEGFALAVDGAGKLEVPNHGVFISPTSDMAVYDLLPVIEKFAPRPFIKKMTSNKITFYNGSTIIVRSAYKPDRLRGLHKDWAYFDEIAHIEDAKAINNILLGLEAGGYVFGGTTPNGYNWFYYDMIEPALLGTKIDNDTFISKNGNIFVTKWNTYQNPYRDPERVKQILNRIKGEKLRRQELYADFVSFAGAIYDIPDEEIIAPAPKSYTDVVVGMDFGFDHPTIMEVGVYKAPTWYVVEEIEIKGKTARQVAEIAKGIEEKYGKARFYVSHERPEVREELAQHGLRVFMAGHNVEYGIDNVKDLFQNGTLKISNAPIFLNEKKSYHYKDGKVYKKNDDACDAIRYLADGIQRPLHVSIKTVSRFARQAIRRRIW